MRFFSRIVFLCNICFIIAVIMWWIESSRRLHGNYNGVIQFQPLAATLIILGYGAVIINFVFILLSFWYLLRKRLAVIPRFILLFNLLIFPLQIYYHFFLH